ncbi:MAG: hypothetical protein ACI4TD_09065 [Phocaeicola sp.]
MIIAVFRLHPKTKYTSISEYTEETLCFKNAKELETYLSENHQKVVIDKLFELSDDEADTCSSYFEWHPYPKEDPPKGDDYLITVKENGCLHTYYTDYEECEDEDYKGYFSGYDNECIVAWAELPKPYKEK